MPVTPRSEDIPWDTLAAFLAGELPESERSVIDRWRAEDPLNEALFTVLQQGWSATAANRRRYDPEAALRWVKGYAHDPVPVVEAGAIRPGQGRMVWPVRSRTGVRRALLAASLAVLVAGTWWIGSAKVTRGLGAHVPAAGFTEYRAEPGRRLALKLPDGSTITLGPDSRLRIAANYGRPARAVELEGDGYFEVPHDAAHPFSVRTRDALARDLGTRFVIHADTLARVTDIVVVEGVVAMGRVDRQTRQQAANHPLASDSLVLEAGQRGRLTEAGVLVRATDVRVDDYVGWVEGRLVIPNLSVAEALRRISRWYGVQVRLADTRAEAQVAGRTVNAVFRDEPVAEAVRLIAAPFALTVERDSSGFVLRAER